MEKYDAAESLRNAAYPPRRLMAVYGGVWAVFLLVCAGVSFGLNAVNIKGGLDTISLQTILTTAQLILPLAGAVLLPAWMAGLWTVALGIARGQQMRPHNLTDGFSRLLPLLASGLLMGVQYAFRGYISMIISSSLLNFTPAGMKMMNAALEVNNGAEPDLRVLLGNDYAWVMGTLYVLFAVVFIAICLPVFYRYRMTGYLIADRQESGGIRAMLRSRMLMFRRRWELAKLDLRFWWYYLLLLLGVAVSCGGWIVELAGLSLPIPHAAVYWICLVAGALIVLGVQVLAGPKVAVTYALRYDRYLQEPPPPPSEPKRPQVAPEALPWQY